MFLVSLALVSFVLVMGAVPIQAHLFRAFGVVQPIRKELPANQQKKRGTPLMGGLVFIIGAFVSWWAQRSALSVFFALLLVCFAWIGFLDDFKKAYTKAPDGISAKTKLLLQSLVTAGALYYLYDWAGWEPSLTITRSVVLDVPLAIFILGTGLIVIGSTNAINFTDGLDGLLSVCAIPTYFFFFAISDSMEIKVFCLVMIACLVGFLFYNRFPAKLIMGDTGSMAIGGTLSVLAVMEHVLILLPILFLVYYAEIISVIVQVAYFKRTGKRIFRMSPIHYHFSLKYGWKENTIVIVFGAVSWLCVIFCLVYVYFFMR